eukprot:1183900-Prorocentrum_minimum.AAC.2
MNSPPEGGKVSPNADSASVPLRGGEFTIRGGWNLSHQGEGEPERGLGLGAEDAADEVCPGGDVTPLVAAADLRRNAVLAAQMHKVVPAPPLPPVPIAQCTHVSGSRARHGRAKKGTPVGAVNRARGPALGSWEDQPPAAHTRTLSVPRLYEGGKSFPTNRSLALRPYKTTTQGKRTSRYLAFWL